ncbi:MAG TPA: sulfatase-like hydrolase/transferase, partial [Gemmatimonadaceae bacterium]
TANTRRPMGPPGRALLVCGAAQFALLLLHDFGADAAGHALQVSPVNALMLQGPLYGAGLLVPAALWSAANWLWPRYKRGWNLIGTLVALTLMIISVLDFGMQRFRGERLSLNQFSAYGTGSVLNSDWLLPVLESRAAAGSILLVLLSSLVALVVVARRRPTDAQVDSRRAAIGFAALAMVLWLPPRFAYSHQRDMARPPQAVLLDELISTPKPLSPADEIAARAGLRQLLDRDGPKHWLSDSFPVWHAAVRSSSPSFGAARNNPPDIVFFVIESLRGRDVGWGFGARRGVDSPTPHLDSLAAQSVTLPHYIASGEPSPRGFITLLSGEWEHGNLFIIANRPNVALDAIPLRLKRAGYHSVALWGGNPSFDNQLTWARRWFNDVVYEHRGNRLFYFRTTPDGELMDTVIQRVAAHDRANAGQPLFLWIASNGTHTPFQLDSGAVIKNDVPPSTDRQRRYDLTLRNVDAQVARVIAYLRTRPRWRNTVIVVTGDHADRTSEPADARWRGMPTDAQVATAALIFGPPALIGRPRTLDFTASHVDILPTIRSWLGDTSATATMGRDLFDTSRVADRQAVSINSRGYRWDRGGFTLMVDSKDPSVFGAWRSFTGEEPKLVPLSETPFASDAPAQLHAAIQYWSSLIDRDRVMARK